MARALVTGGSGYFGSVLVGDLAAHGDQVRTFDVNEPDGHPAGTEHLGGDIRDLDAVLAACEGIDVVYHNVAQQPLAKAGDLIESVNVGGTDNLLRAARQAGVAKVVFTSSTAVYGVPRSHPVDEQTPPAPVELYGRAKVRAEALCWQAARAGLDVTIVRPRTIVGHGRLGIFALLFDWVADGADVFVFGKGDNRYQFVHADDLASACRLAGARAGSTSYNVGAAEFGTMREVLEALVRHAGTGSRVRSLPVAPAMAAMAALSKVGMMPFGPYHWLLYGKTAWFDITKARTELGWQPVHSNESMICQSYDWFLAHRAELGGRGRSLHQAPAPPGVLRLVKRVAAARRTGRGR